MAKYILKYDNQCIEMSKANSSILIYKLPYMLIKNKTHGLNISNRFIVYILFGTNDKGKDIIYVGKSKNGIDNRPAAHEDKNTNWQLCYILTTFKERTFFNDGTIQYIEDKIRQRIDFIDRYINTTKQTTSGTANMFDEEDCDDYLREAYNMLFSIGLDLIENPVPVVNTNKKNYEIAPGMMPLYNKFLDMLKTINKDIEVISCGTYIKFVLDKDILGSIISNNTALKISFNTTLDKLDKNTLLEDITNKGNNGVGGCRFTFKDDTDFDQIKSWINQVINL